MWMETARMAVSVGVGRVFAPVFCCISMTILAALVPLVPLGMAPGVTVLSVFCCGAVLLHRRHLPLPDPLLLASLGLFLVWSGLSLFWSAGGSKSVSSFLGFLYLWLPSLFLLSVLATLPVDVARRTARKVLPAAAVGLALFAVELLADQPIQHWAAAADKDVLDFERDLNRAALLVALLAGPVSLLLWSLGRRLVACVALALPLLMAAYSTSQSSVAALLGLIILLGLALWSWRLVAGLIGAGVVAGFLFCGPIVHWMLSAGLSSAAWMPPSFRHRIMTWEFVVQHLGDHLWIGWGLDASRAVPGGNATFPNTGPPDWPVLPIHPHNLFLQVRLELGWVGAALTALLLLAVLRCLTRLDAGIRPMAIALFGTCIFTQCFAYGAWQGWLICGMLFGGCLIALAGRVKAPS